MAPLRIELFGGLRVRQGPRVIERFRTQKTASLLAHLATFADQSHSREALADRFWPDQDPNAARLSLNSALYSLRKQLEPPGTPRGSVIVGDRHVIHLNLAAYASDLQEMRKAIRLADETKDPIPRVLYLEQAVTILDRQFLPGHDDEWIEQERRIFEEMHLALANELVETLSLAGESRRALPFARQAARLNPYGEGTCHALLEVLVACGETDTALDEYRAFERRLTEIGLTPSPDTQAAVAHLHRRPRGRRSTIATPPTVQSGPSVEQRANVPLRLNRFFGREDELDRLAALVLAHDVRLVTLTGAGGSGKTRLALELADRLSDPYGHRVWFVALADLIDARQVAEEIRDVLGLPREGAPLPSVCCALDQAAALLVLDNLEHLGVEAVGVVHAILSQARNVTCLVTSRRKLSLPGEREFPVRPLPIPDVVGLDPERLQTFPSVQLFVDRAQTAKPDYQITPRTADTVAALCQRLEGIPLALELAAARAQVLTPGQMLEQLAHGFDILAQPRGGKERRHQSLLATIEWSYDLLGPDLQTLFNRLSCFRGGWTLEAAERICAPAGSIHDAMAQLATHSLVQSQAAETGMRFRMLESLREVADSKLRPHERTDLRTRHAEHFANLTSESFEHLDRPELSEWTRRLEEEHDNIRVAVQWAIESGAARTAMRLAMIWRFWLARGYMAEGLRWSLDSLALPGAQERTALRAHVLNGAAGLAYRIGDFTTSKRAFEEARDIRNEIGDEAGAVRILGNIAHIYVLEGDLTQAEALYQQSLEGQLRFGELERASVSINNLARVAMFARDYDRAVGLFDEALARDVAAGHLAWQAFDHCGLGLAKMYQGNWEQARSHFIRSLDLFESAGNKSAAVLSLQGLAVVEAHAGHLAEGIRYLIECLQMCLDSAVQQVAIQGLERAAELLAMSAAWSAVAELLGAAESHRSRTGFMRPPCDCAYVELARQGALESLGSEAFEASLSAGVARELHEAIERAIQALQDALAYVS